MELHSLGQRAETIRAMKEAGEEEGDEGEAPMRLGPRPTPETTFTGDWGTTKRRARGALPYIQT